jgi:hypothetical protein
LATMRDTTKRRNYSAEAEEFRREHQRHRVWGMTQRHARKLRSIYGHIPSEEELTTAWHDRSAAASASATSEQALRGPAVPPEPTPSGPEQVEPETAVAKRVEPETAVAEPVATVGAAGGRSGHGVPAAESESAPEEAVVVAAPVRRVPARTCCNWYRERVGHLWVRGGDDAVRPDGQPLNSWARFAPSAGDCPASWTSRFARSPPLRWRLPTVQHRACAGGAVTPDEQVPAMLRRVSGPVSGRSRRASAST